MTPTPPPADGMEWGTLAQWVGPWITSAVALLIAVWGRFSNRDEKVFDDFKKDIKADISALRADDARIFGRVDEVEERVAMVETEIKHLPNREDVSAVKMEVHTLKAVVEARFEALSQQLATIIAQNQRAHDRLAEREDRK